MHRKAAPALAGLNARPSADALASAVVSTPTIAPVVVTAVPIAANADTSSTKDATMTLSATTGVGSTSAAESDTAAGTYSAVKDAAGFARPKAAAAKGPTMPPSAATTKGSTMPLPSGAAATKGPTMPPSAAAAKGQTMPPSFASVSIMPSPIPDVTPLASKKESKTKDNGSSIPAAKLQKTRRRPAAGGGGGGGDSDPEWRPPAGQTGDGRTSLNAKLGY